MKSGLLTMNCKHFGYNFLALAFPSLHFCGLNVYIFLACWSDEQFPFVFHKYLTMMIRLI